MQIDLGAVVQRAIEFRLATGADRLHRAFEHLGIQREADLMDLTALFIAEQLASATKVHDRISLVRMVVVLVVCVRRCAAPGRSPAGV